MRPVSWPHLHRAAPDPLGSAAGAGVARRARRGAVAFVAGVVLVTLAAIPAAAAGQGRPFHLNFDFTTPQEFCGLSLIGHHQGVTNFWLAIDRDGLPHLKQTDVDRNTLTNPATGRSIVWFGAGQGVDTVPATFIGPDVYTVTSAVDGVPERLTAPDGTLLSTDVGRIVTTYVVDDAGTPADPSDDVVLSFTVVMDAGSHPAGETGGGLNCAAAVPALT